MAFARGAEQDDGGSWRDGFVGLLQYPDLCMSPGFGPVSGTVQRNLAILAVIVDRVDAAGFLACDDAAGHFHTFSIRTRLFA